VKRVLVVLLGALLLVAALAGAAFVGLALTETGTRFLAAQAERLLPLRLVGVSGTLWRNLRVERLRLQLERQALVVEELAVELNLVPLLFDNRLVLREVRARSVELVELEPPDPAAPPARLLLPFMPIELMLDRLAIEVLRIPGAPVVAVAGSATWTAAGVDVRELSINGDEISVALRGRFSAGARPVLEAALEWSLPLAGWAGSGELSGPVDDLAVAQQISGAYPFGVTGMLDLSLPARPAFDVTVIADDQAAEAWALDGVEAQIAGTLEALEVAAQARLDARYGQPFPIAVRVRGPLLGPLAIELRAEPLDGVVEATGSADWTDGLRVVAEGSARGLALAPVLDGHTGELGADFALEYGAAGVDLALTDLAGAVDGRPVSGQARILGGGEAGWTVEAAELAVGDNRAQLAGRWQAGAIVVDGRIVAPALEQLGLGLAGAVDAEVSLAGRWPALDGQVALRGPAVTAEGLEFADLVGSAQLAGGKLDAQLTAARLVVGGAEFEALELTLAGALDALDWQLAWSQGESRGRLVQAAGDWRFDVAALQADVATVRLAIDGPFSVQNQAGTVTVTPVCLSGAEARACLAVLRVQDGRIATTGRLERLPLALLQGYLPVEFDPGSHLEGRWDVSGAGNSWTGSVELAARDLGIDWPDAEEQRFQVPDVTLVGTFAGAALDLALLTSGEAYRIEGTGRLAPIAADGQLSGALVFGMTEFDWLRDLDSRLDDLGGALTVELALSGTAKAPVVEGVLEFEEGRVALEDPGFVLEGLAVTARVDRDGAFEFSGRGAQPSGKVELEGRGSGLFGGELELEATLRGDNLRATHPQFEATVAPDLEFALRQGIARVTGTVDLPRAAVRLNALPVNVPRPSPDVIVLGREVPAANGAPNRLRMNVRVRLGREVSLTALGAQAKLQGDLRVRRDARGQTSVRGTLDVAGGRIDAQGQSLVIESGVVVYNGPVGNPFIDVRAVREIPNQTPPVKVGLRIRGDANRLNSTIFSEPAMAENRALAFLVLGRDIDAQSDADSGQLLTAAINLGLSQSKSLIGELQRAAGLDELSAVAEGEDSFALAAGKQIGEDLYLRYTYNTLTAVGAILISMDLTDQWRLEALSGEDSAMDILYRIER
jgi:translocation and assembly module TamB